MTVSAPILIRRVLQLMHRLEHRLTSIEHHPAIPPMPRFLLGGLFHLAHDQEHRRTPLSVSSTVNFLVHPRHLVTR